MGLFDRFAKRVRAAADKADAESLTAEEDSIEAREALSFAEAANEFHRVAREPDIITPDRNRDDDDGWDDIEEESSNSAPERLSKRERRHKEKQDRELLERASVRPKGSQIDLKMGTTTTGRKLVSVSSAPKGSFGAGEQELGSGRRLRIDLGGGVVEKGGRVIKAGRALDELLEELEWAMLESDISSTAVEEVLRLLKDSLIGSRLRSGADLAKVIEATLKRALHSLLEANYWDFDASVKRLVSTGEEPVVVMLVGVNGTGKTTTLAKIGKRMTDEGYHVVAAAADTFRAGAIEQLETHMSRLGIKCISSQRGGDSAAIARDAIEHARARKADIVLVDTAGRMQNKKNLMEELRKVHRITRPHLVLFVADALAGNDAVQQAVQFSEMLSFDGAVLTKMDTDAKGGAGLSIAHATGRPIVLAGIGQGYDDLIQFEPTWLMDQLFGV